MVENKQDQLVRAYAILKSLQTNIEKIPSNNIEEIYVNEYHTMLDRLEAIGLDISEFRIPDLLVKPIITSWTKFEGGRESKSYSKEKYVEKSFILTKLDAILGYFEIITSEKPRKIGFNK